mmetsp:Transcript_8474/g.23640  ORF Transcript_8474/g.23640 Transcript_8474/m.23640 type:complete len:314 (-) Transcript_8474:515-1456(-)
MVSTHPPSSSHGCWDSKSSEVELRSRTSAATVGVPSFEARLRSPGMRLVPARVARPCGGVRGGGVGLAARTVTRAGTTGGGAGDRVFTTRAGTLAGGARSLSTSTNFDSAAGSNFSTSSTSSSSYSYTPSFSSSSSFSGDAGGPGSSSSSSKSSGLSSNASAAAEMASGSRAPRRCVTRRGPSIRTVPTSGTTDRYVFHSTDPPSIASSSSSSSTTSILVRGLLAPVLTRRLARNDDDLWSLDVAATATKATAAPMTTSTSVRAVSLTCASSVCSGKNVRAPADVREMSARRAPAPVASAALVLDQMPTAAAS